MTGVLLIATRLEAAGAAMTVAGLTVLERAVRQLARMGRSPVVVASDGSVPMSDGLDVRPAHTPEALDDLRRELDGFEEIAADVVRPTNKDLTGGIRVIDAATRRQAEDAIFAQLLRGDLGLVARYLNKPVSFRITRHALCRLPVTPNQVTLAAGLVGLIGCALVATGQLTLMVAGFFLSHVQSVLDGCDGELARVRFQQSPLGAWLDQVVDDTLNVVMMACIGVGLWRMTGSVGLAAAAGAGVVMCLTYNLTVYREIGRQKVGAEVQNLRWWFGGGKELRSLSEGTGGSVDIFYNLGRRDVICFAFVLLAALGWFKLILLWWLIVLSVDFVVAVGQLIFGAPAARG